MIVIRPAREADYEGLAQVWHQGWVLPEAGVTEPPPELLDELRARIPREIESGGWSVFAALEDGHIVGLLGITRTETCLNALFVAEARRSRGIGKRMLAFAKEEMPGGFWLRTRIENRRSQQFYEREGLVATHDAPHPHHPEAMFRHYRWR